MVSGLVENLGLVCENEGGDDDEVDTGLVDEWRHTPTIDSNEVIRTCTTGESPDCLAIEKKIGTKLHLEVVKAEQRVKYIRNLSILGVGTNRIEENQIKSRKELVKDTGR